MKLSKVTSYTRYLSIIEQYHAREGKNNDYLQRDADCLIRNGKLYEYCEGANAYLFVEKTIGWSLYFYINDFEIVPDFQCVKDVVIEILYRGDKFYPFQEIEFFEKAGFKVNLVRDQFLGVYEDLIKTNLSDTVSVACANDIEEVREACELFNHSFDVLSGDYIAEDEYESLLKNHSILVARGEKYEFLGALHQSFVGKVASISHIAVVQEARGKHVGQALLEEFIENNKAGGKGRYMLWVQRQNLAAVKMYQRKGFKYVSKSTISLIK